MASAPPPWYSDMGTNIQPSVGVRLKVSSKSPCRLIKRSIQRGSEYWPSSYPRPEEDLLTD